jgi:hypothetical protein
MVSIDWEAQAKRVDDTVDAVFGEDVQLIPVITGPMSGPITDPDRNAKTIVGIFMTNDEVRAENISSADFTKMTDAHYGLSIQKINFDGGFKKGDHVLFLKASREGARYEISLIGPSESGRMVLGLLKL